MKIPKASGGIAGGESNAALRQLPKPIDSSLLYEPTSVLDPHLTSSPSATAAGGGGALYHAFDAVAPYYHWDPTPFPLLTNSSASAADDWPDSLSWLLADTNSSDIQDPCSFFPDLSLPPSLPATAGAAFDGSQLDLLLRAATAVESGELNSAHEILARLNVLLPSPSGGPLQRAAFHFKDALLSLLLIPNHPAAEPSLTALELVRRIAAHKALSDFSPIPQFTAFTANQTLLECLDAAPSFHLIDFDLGLGSQWSSFVQEIASRCRAAHLPSPALRITAIVAEETAETTLAAENLCGFASGVGLRLRVEFAQIGALSGVQFSSSEAVAVVLTPAIFRLTGISVLRFVRRAAAKVVVFIDMECFGDHGNSFRRRLTRGLEYYVTAMEAVEAGAAAAGAGEESVRRIEMAVFRPRIFSAAAAAAVDWREMMASAGMASAELSLFTESQAEWLLRRAPVAGYHVTRREEALVVSWKGRELAAMSAWRCR